MFNSIRIIFSSHCDWLQWSIRRNMINAYATAQLSRGLSTLMSSVAVQYLFQLSLINVTTEETSHVRLLDGWNLLLARMLMFFFKQEWWWWWWCYCLLGMPLLLAPKQVRQVTRVNFNTSCHQKRGETPNNTPPSTCLFLNPVRLVNVIPFKRNWHLGLIVYVVLRPDMRQLLNCELL